MKYNTLIAIAAIFFLFSCKQMTPEEIDGIGKAYCGRMPPFVNKLGFDQKRLSFSTYVAQKRGIVLIQIPLPNDTTSGQIYQKDSWSKHGDMGAITTASDGSTFTAPIPIVNTLQTPLSQMNKIYKIDPIDGEMKEFCELPKADTGSGVVPYAILGLYYDCHGDKLYASSVAGSNRDQEKGVIYAINPHTGKVEDKFVGIDALGLFVSGVNGTKNLYFGKARSSEIMSIELSKTGSFIGKPKPAFTLDQLGPRGDDKARKIREDSNGSFYITGVEFNYSLAAPSVIPTTLYKFWYDSDNKKWNMISAK